MKQTAYVAYYRVSTKKQGIGLVAQKTAVKNYLKDKWPPVAEFKERESGKSAKNRPELQKALEYCKKHKAVLVVAKLDRLSRDLHFITSLRKAGINFVCCDFPNMDKLQLHILGSLAEWERDQISDRTRRALAEKKKQGVKLGWNNPKIREGIKKYWREWKRDNPPKHKKKKAGAAKPAGPKISKRVLSDRRAVPMIKILRKQGLSFESIAKELNGSGMTTRRDRKWHRTSVRRIAERNGLIKLNPRRGKLDRRVLPMIKRMRKKGLAFGSIAKELNSAGIPTTQSGKWHITTVRLIAKKNGLLNP